MKKQNKNLFLNSQASESVKKHRFFPYQDKVRNAYFTYSGLFWFFGTLVLVSSLFVIINLAVNNKFQFGTSINEINIFCTPILNIALVIISWALLLFAPNKIYQSPKNSGVMFYFSFWFLVISVMLNAQLQISYAETYVDSVFYHWIDLSVLKVLAVLMVFALFFIQVFFWVMRRKFAFQASDYEIYLDIKAKKADKKERKRLAKIQKNL